MSTIQFNFRDISKSVRLAFNFQRIGIQVVGLFYGYLGYLVLTYLSLISAGMSINSIWSSFGLLPSIIGKTLPLYASLIGYAAMLFFLFWYLISSIAVARSTYMHLKGNDFYTAKQALKFALKSKSGAVISAPLAILVMIAVIVVVGFIAGLAGKIPIVGPVVISVLTVLWYSASFLLIFLMLALVMSMVMTPAILATTDDDAFEGIFQSFALLHGQPVRFIIYELLLLFFALLGFFILALFAKAAWGVMTTILIRSMGDKMADISYQAVSQLQTMVYPAVVWGKATLGSFCNTFFFKESYLSLNLSPALQLSSVIMSSFMVLIGGLIISFPAAILNCGQTIIFIILKKIKENDNLLERVDDEYDEKTTNKTIEKNNI